MKKSKKPDRRGYVACPGSPFPDRIARLVAREMDAMDREGVVVKPAALLARARSRSHPLHKVFEWNDGKAAEQWRINQARKLIACVYVWDGPGPPKRGRYYVTIAGPPTTTAARPRHLVAADAAQSAEVSNNLCARIRAAVADAAGQGLPGQDPWWRRVADAVTSGKPMSALFGEDASAED